MPGTGLRDCRLSVRAGRSSPEASQAGTLAAWRAKALAKWGTALAQHPDGLPGTAKYYFFILSQTFRRSLAIEWLGFQGSGN